MKKKTQGKVRQKEKADRRIRGQKQNGTERKPDSILHSLRSPKLCVLQSVFKKKKSYKKIKNISESNRKIKENDLKNQHWYYFLNGSIDIVE